ncbi:MAG: SprT-like domain-containing protein, partial [Bacteroidota bacterium]
GDYRYDPRSKQHTITLNNDLNPYSFLITYIHEVAHLATFRKYGRSVDPHGEEWKENFKKGMEPVLSTEIFPEKVLAALHRHLLNPKAASCSDPILYEVLRQYDAKAPNETTLRQITNGDRFDFQGQTYRKLEKRRTRALCQRLSDNRKYLISEVATVLKISD